MSYLVIYCKVNFGIIYLHTDIFYYTSCHHYLLDKGDVFGSVGLCVCLSVCGQYYSKSYERIGVKFSGGVLGSTMKN